MFKMQQIQEVEQAFKNIVEQIQPKSASKPSQRVSLPNTELSVGELATVLSVLAREYNTTLPNLLSKLDKVSGDLNELDKLFKGDSKVEWTPEEDELLGKNEGLLRRWKGDDVVDRRKKYLSLWLDFYSSICQSLFSLIYSDIARLPSPSQFAVGACKGVITYNKFEMADFTNMIGGLGGSAASTFIPGLAENM